LNCRLSPYQHGPKCGIILSMQPKPIRLQHYLAQCGIASRRRCEELISAGKIQVNGAIVKIPGTKIIPGVDKVLYQNQEIKPLDLIYLALNKPAGYISTRRDRFAAHTVMELLPEELRGIVFPVGRLDRESRGLMLFTNDGKLAFQLSHPRFEQEKEYRVTILGESQDDDLEILRQGIKSRELNTAPAIVQKLQKAKNKTILKVILKEGQKREIRRMFSYIKFKVLELERVRLGKLKLGDLKPGEWRYVKKEEII
jgi:23S rRNA pseudouridine2605 synthase